MLLVAAACSSSGYSHGQDVQQLQREQAALHQQIAAKQKQIDALRNRPSPEQAELADAQREVDAARTAYKTTPNPDNEAKLKNAEFKYTLAERKFAKSHSEIDTLKADIDKLNAQIAAKQQQAQAVAQRATAEQAAARAKQQQQQQKLAEERTKRLQQQQELDRARQETEAQQREIARLKAMLAAKEAAAAAAAKAAPAPAPAPSLAKAQPAAMPAANAASSSDVNGPGAHQLTSQQQVVKALQAVEKHLADLSVRERGGINDILYIRNPNRKATNKDKVTLKALGKEQYRGEAEVEPGNYDLVIGFNKWPHKFGGDDRGTFVFLYDNSNPQKPRLLFYKQTLEGGS